MKRRDFRLEVNQVLRFDGPLVAHPIHAVQFVKRATGEALQQPCIYDGGVGLRAVVIFGPKVAKDARPDAFPKARRWLHA